MGREARLLDDEAGHVDAAVAQFPLDAAPGQFRVRRDLRPDHRGKLATGTECGVALAMRDILLGA